MSDKKVILLVDEDVAQHQARFRCEDPTVAALKKLNPGIDLVRVFSQPADVAEYLRQKPSDETVLGIFSDQNFSVDAGHDAIKPITRTFAWQAFTYPGNAFHSLYVAAGSPPIEIYSNGPTNGRARLTGDEVYQGGLRATKMIQAWVERCNHTTLSYERGA